MILTKRIRIQDGIIKFVALTAMAIGFGLTTYHFFWGKDPEENILRFIGYLLIFAGFVLGMFSTKSLRKGGIHKDGPKRSILTIINMALYVFVTINYFLAGGFTILNSSVLSIALVFSLSLLYFSLKLPQQLSED